MQVLVPSHLSKNLDEFFILLKNDLGCLELEPISATN